MGTRDSYGYHSLSLYGKEAFRELTPNWSKTWWCNRWQKRPFERHGKYYKHEQSHAIIKVFYDPFSLIISFDPSAKRMSCSGHQWPPMYIPSLYSVSVHFNIRWGVIGLISTNQARHINLHPIIIHLWCVCCWRSWASIVDGPAQVERVFCLCICQQI